MHDIIQVGPWGLGLLRSAMGIGGILVAAFLTLRPIEDHAGVKMFTAVAFFGAFIVLFGISTTLWLSVIALMFAGAADMVSVYVRETLLQLWTPDDVRGRVNAIYVTCLFAGGALGSFAATGLYERWGWSAVAFAGGAAGIAALALFGVEKISRR